MRTKTVKTIYKSILQQWPEGISVTKVAFPNLPGLDPEELREHDLLALPQKSKVGLYSFLHADQYEAIDSSECSQIMKEWISSITIDFCVL
mmetsp:Transcript_62784/g.149814  ORF Transcript_62784/g.149814 Transcript_62784/m.149814 type:complete len:91 (+) Transcript_62784:919-1191(+)